MYKTHEIIMLPTEGKSYIHTMTKKNGEKCNTTDKLRISGVACVDSGNLLMNKNQHLYLLSDEEIKEGDWYCFKTITGYTIKQFNQEKYFAEEPCVSLTNLKAKKILATTDSSLTIKMIGNKVYDESKDVEFYGFKSGVGLQSHITEERLPQFPQSLIELFVKRYNEGAPLSKVEVKYEEMNDEELGIDPAYFPVKERLKLKLNSSNEFSYKPLKPSLKELCKQDNDLKEEVIELFNKMDNELIQYKFENNPIKTIENWVKENL